MGFQVISAVTAMFMLSTCRGNQQTAKTTTTIMSVRTTFFLGICSSGWSLEDSSWLGISWNHIFRARDDGKRHDVVDEQ